MLLFVRNPYAALLRSGRKTLEIRAGSRYARIRVGQILRVNGRQFSLRVDRVERYETRAALLSTLSHRHHAAGFDSPGALCGALRACYPHDTPPYTILHVVTV